MIIYFINNGNRSKRPCDVKLPEQESFLRNGDICIKEKEDRLEFIIITSPQSQWGGNNIIHTIELSESTNLPNQIIFGYDGINKREGNKKSLQILLEVSSSNIIISNFFDFALKILKYQEDLWETAILVPFLQGSREHITDNKNLTNNQNIVSKSSGMTVKNFLDYMSSPLQEKFKMLYSENHDLGKTYRKLRKLMPKEFQQSLVTFIRENPNGNIYETNLL